MQLVAAVQRARSEVLANHFMCETHDLRHCTTLQNLEVLAPYPVVDDLARHGIHFFWIRDLAPYVKTFLRLPAPLRLLKRASPHAACIAMHRALSHTPVPQQVCPLLGGV